MYPHIIVDINGRPIASGGYFVSHLVSISIDDYEGIKSDTIELVFEAAKFFKVPRNKDKIRAWMGYQQTGAVYFGSFDINDVELQCYPHMITVNGKASDYKSELKTNQSRNWDDTTLGKVFSELAQENNLQPIIRGEIANIKDTYFNMDNESVLHYGERIAKQYNGLFDIKDGKLLLMDKGMGLSASGQSISPFIVTPEMHVVGSCKTKFNGRESYKDVESQFQNKQTAKREIIKTPADPKGEGTLRKRHAYASRKEAEHAAKSTAKQLQRDSITTSVDIEGNPLARGGIPFSYNGFHPELDPIPFIIENATHRFAKDQAYLTSVNGKLKI